MTGYLIHTSFAGEFSAATLKDARNIAARLDTPEFDKPRIFQWLDGCPGDCTCGGQIHPQSIEVE